MKNHEIMKESNNEMKESHNNEITRKRLSLFARKEFIKHTQKFERKK